MPKKQLDGESQEPSILEILGLDETGESTRMSNIQSERENGESDSLLSAIGLNGTRARTRQQTRSEGTGSTANRPNHLQQAVREDIEEKMAQAYRNNTPFDFNTAMEEALGRIDGLLTPKPIQPNVRSPRRPIYSLPPIGNKAA